MRIQWLVIFLVVTVLGSGRVLLARSDIDLPFIEQIPLSTLHPPPRIRKFYAFAPKQSRNFVKWPQQDDRVYRAVVNGERMGFDPPKAVNRTAGRYDHDGETYEAPIPGLATVVTAYYDMEAKHTKREYMAWLLNFLASTDPLVIFCQKNQTTYNTTWYHEIVKHRQHAPTIIAELPFGDLNMAVTFTEAWWNRTIKPMDESEHHKDNDLYKIWNEKMILVYEVARLNPFDSEHIFWLDAGYFRKDRYRPLRRPIVRNNVSANGVLPHQVIFHHVKPAPLHSLAGGAWGGPISAIPNLYDRYWETFWHMVTLRQDVPGIDQRVFVWMCASFPDICHIHHDPFWFALGGFMLRNEKYNFAAKRWGDMPHNATSGQLVVSNDVKFPSEHILT